MSQEIPADQEDKREPDPKTDGADPTENSAPPEEQSERRFSSMTVETENSNRNPWTEALAHNLVGISKPIPPGIFTIGVQNERAKTIISRGRDAQRELHDPKPTGIAWRS